MTPVGGSRETRVFAIRAKHDNMQNQKNSCGSLSNLFLEPPAYPKMGNEIFRRLKLSVERAEGLAAGQLTQKQFGKLIGMPRSTVNDWYHGSLAPEIRHLICALERISEGSRLELLRAWCRKCPRLDDPRLAHDLKAVKSLKEVAARSSGLTIVRGASDVTRTFLFTALGHWAVNAARGAGVRGVDLHGAFMFVPVSGVLYLRSQAGLGQAAGLVKGLLDGMNQSTAPLLLFNGVWEALPSARDSIIQLAQSRHVITTGALCKYRFGPPTVVVTVTEDSQRRIFTRIETDQPRA